MTEKGKGRRFRQPFSLKFIFRRFLIGEIKLQYLCKDMVTADVVVDYRNRSVRCVVYTDDFIITPFGKRAAPTIKDFEEFLESRCFPRERRNCAQLLADLGLSHYWPLDIVLKTHGRQLEDFCWIKFDGEKLDYERDIKLRD